MLKDKEFILNLLEFALVSLRVSKITVLCPIVQVLLQYKVVPAHELGPRFRKGNAAV